MNDVARRLESCFLLVFPDLRPEDVGQARPETIPGFDSLGLATLVSVIEEEFGVLVPIEDLESGTAADGFSFGSLRAYLEARRP